MFGMPSGWPACQNSTNFAGPIQIRGRARVVRSPFCEIIIILFPDIRDVNLIAENTSLRHASRPSASLNQRSLKDASGLAEFEQRENDDVRSRRERTPSFDYRLNADGPTSTTRKLGRLWRLEETPERLQKNRTK